MLAGHTLVQGILAALVRRFRTGAGASVETSLLEVLVDLQFEVLTTHLNDGHRLPVRSAVNGAHAYLGAPYGVYRTTDGWLALAMTPSLERLAGLMGLSGLEGWYSDAKAAMRDRDAIKARLADAIATQPSAHWLALLQPADIWCAEVLDWPRLLASEAFRRLEMIQHITGPGASLDTLRGPLRLNGQALTSPRAAPALGADRDRIIDEFGLGGAAAGESTTAMTANLGR
jgi:crotonobetainyl-CoA:carnitine CoA-transferase CaiB-like acyl-CoA transferase